jgi:hypothetical protein
MHDAICIEINLAMVYLLITTEFKRASKKLGELDEYSKKVAENIDQIDQYLLNKVNELKLNCSFRPHFQMVCEIRNIHNEIKSLNDEIMLILIHHFKDDECFENDDFCIETYMKFFIELGNDNILEKMIGRIDYQNIMDNYQQIKLLEIQKRNTQKLVRIEKEEEKERNKIFQVMMKESFLMNQDIKQLGCYNEIIKGSEFKAVILNHHFFNEPHLHIVYTVLKYDLITKSVYIDIFVSTTQYIKKNETKHREFFPKMFDETMNNTDFVNRYADKIYKTIKKDLKNQNLMIQRLMFLNNAVSLDNTGDTIDFNQGYARLKLQKNIAQYMSGQTPIDDNQTKVKLCNLKHIDSSPADDKYKYIIGRTKEIVKERGILNEKNYTVIATSYNLLKQYNDIAEKSGEENGHAETQLMKKYCDNIEIMMGFKNGTDPIYVIRIYQNGNFGNGIPCSRCVSCLNSNGIHRVLYSMDENYFQECIMDNHTYTYTTTGNKLLRPNEYLYSDFLMCF